MRPAGTTATGQNPPRKTTGPPPPIPAPRLAPAQARHKTASANTPPHARPPASAAAPARPGAPPQPRGVTSEARFVREHPADGDGLDRPERAGGLAELGQVGHSRIIQVQPASLAQLHNGGPRECLGDRGDTVKRGHRWQQPGTHLSDPNPADQVTPGNLPPARATPPGDRLDPLRGDNGHRLTFGSSTSRPAIDRKSTRLNSRHLG